MGCGSNVLPTLFVPVGRQSERGTAAGGFPELWDSLLECSFLLALEDLAVSVAEEMIAAWLS